MTEPPILTREEWLKARRSCIGASDAAAVCGMSAATWGATALQVYLDKLGLLPEQETNIAMRMGIALEPLLSELYSETTGKALIIPPQMQRHKDFPWIGCNPDRYCKDEARNVQLKVSYANSDEWGDPGTDQVPEYYLIQISHEMAVTGLPITDLAVLFKHSNTFAIYTIPRNEELIATIVEIETEFWQEHVLKQIPPDPDYKHPSTLRLMKVMYPGITDGKILDTPADQVDELRKTITAYKAAGDRARDAKQEQDEAKAFLLSMMGDAAQLQVGSDWTLTRKAVERKAYEVQATTYIDFRIRDNNKPKKGTK